MNKKIIVFLVAVIAVIVLAFLAVQTFQRLERQLPREEDTKTPLSYQEIRERLSVLETKIFVVERTLVEKKESFEEIDSLFDDFFQLEMKISLEEIGEKEGYTKLVELEEKIDHLINEHDLEGVVDKEIKIQERVRRFQEKVFETLLTLVETEEIDSLYAIEDEGFDLVSKFLGNEINQEELYERLEELEKRIENLSE